MDKIKVTYSDIPVIPMPKSVKGDEPFVFDVPVSTEIYTEEKEWQNHIDAFIDTIYRGRNLKFTRGKNGAVIKFNDKLNKGEYSLKTFPQVEIQSSSSEGVCYALATLIQLIKVIDGKSFICKCEIFDYPETDYRGVMACASQSKRKLAFNNLLVFADLCYLYKMNYLHIHFTDNDGYTLPSERFPKISAGNCYSKEQIKFLNEYCKQRNITIVPEIDLPGHATAMIKNCSEIFANVYTEKSPLWEDGTPCAEDSICVGKKGTFEAAETLIEELAKLFPDSPYLHIGGDEVNHRVWDACDDCQAFIKENNLTDSEELYAYSVKRFAEKVISLGRTPIVWEGFAEKYADIIPKECIVGVFESLYCTADKLIEKGYRVLNCSWEPLYSVSWGSRLWWPDMKPWGYKEILAWDKFTFKNKYMKTSPVHLNPMHLPKTDKIIGAQMCDWANYFAQKIAYIREFVPAVSERLWTNERFCTDEQFFKKFCNSTVVFDELTENNDIYKE